MVQDMLVFLDDENNVVDSLVVDINSTILDNVVAKYVGKGTKARWICFHNDSGLPYVMQQWTKSLYVFYLTGSRFYG